MNAQETRLLPLRASIAAEYALVSMAKTTWYWLDTMVDHYYPYGGYDALIHDLRIKTSDELVQTLGWRAQMYFDGQMRKLYALANDNESIFPVPPKANAAHPARPDLSARMPTVYQLFRFMPHATYLTTVWERQNYHLQEDLI